MLRTRALILFSVQMVFRMGQILLQNGGWFGDIVPCAEAQYTKCIGTYNNELLDTLTPWMGYILIAVHLISALICILGYW